MNIIVLAGGASDERDVSLRSGAAVAQALLDAGHEVTTLDPGDNVSALLPQLQAADVVFPALHGIGGEDGELQAFCESQAIKLVGSDAAASRLCFDKAKYTVLLEAHDIAVPRTELVSWGEYQTSLLALEPHVLKPNDGGSSIDTFIVRQLADRDLGAIELAFGRHSQLLLQSLVEGVEITVAVLGETGLPVIEIIPPHGKEFDYENKYNGATQELCPPLHVSHDLQLQAQMLAVQIHNLTGCSDLSRTDMIIAHNGKLVVLETNTIPGLTNESLLPKAAEAAGYDMPELCDGLVKATLTD